MAEIMFLKTAGEFAREICGKKMQNQRWIKTTKEY